MINQKKRTAFMDEYMTAQNFGGIAVTDDTAKYQTIESKPILVDDASANSAKKKIYDYFGISEKNCNRDI